MPKLPKQYQFLDLSDYGRAAATEIARALKKTEVTPIQLTTWFIISGILAIIAILTQHFWVAAFFLILKSILDAADGELAREKNTPSYTGRYYDSVADIILNFFILLSIGYITDCALIVTLLAFFGMQLQGTLYNYYYVILRNKFGGDKTSRIFENEVPTAMSGENQRQVNMLFGLFKFLYKPFDWLIYQLDKNAIEGRYFPKRFMTAISTFGLGFQLLIIAIMLVLGLENFIIPFFIFYSIFIFIFIGFRKFINAWE